MRVITLKCDYCINNEVIDQDNRSLGAGWYRLVDFTGESKDVCLSCVTKLAHSSARAARA